jgi:RNA polymerase sigma-54 factor
MLSQKVNLGQEQRLRMNPQLFQSIKLMEIPAGELLEKIDEELERNPALELVQKKSGDGLSYGSQNRESYGKKAGSEETDAHQTFIEGALSSSETLQDRLLWELRLQKTEGSVRDAAELIVQNLDGDGFHIEPVDILLKMFQAETVAAALDIVRRLDPQGCATSDYAESLQVQAAIRFPDDYENIKKIISHLEEIERGRLSGAAKSTGLPQDTIEKCFTKIKTLSRFPGRNFDSGGSGGGIKYVIPDVQVVRNREPDGAEFSILLNDEAIPALGIAPFFLDIEKTQDKQTRDFVKENISEARWFINTINRRKHTLLRVTRAIVHFQKKFFENGPKHIAPLTLSDVAQTLELHEATVSRATNGKFIQTEWGLYELKHFFTNSVGGKNAAGSSENNFSKEGVKEIIRELITREASARSDQVITKLLEKRGIKLARRTVAKYRKELDLDSSYTRKQS